MNHLYPDWSICSLRARIFVYIINEHMAFRQMHGQAIVGAHQSFQPESGFSLLDFYYNLLMSLCFAYPTLQVV